MNIDLCLIIFNLSGPISRWSAAANKQNNALVIYTFPREEICNFIAEKEGSRLQYAGVAGKDQHSVKVAVSFIRQSKLLIATKQHKCSRRNYWEKYTLSKGKEVYWRELKISITLPRKTASSRFPVDLLLLEVKLLVSSHCCEVGREASLWGGGSLRSEHLSGKAYYWTWEARFLMVHVRIWPL